MSPVSHSNGYADPFVEVGPDFLEMRVVFGVELHQVYVRRG